MIKVFRCGIFAVFNRPQFRPLLYVVNQVRVITSDLGFSVNWDIGGLLLQNANKMENLFLSSYTLQMICETYVKN